MALPEYSIKDFITFQAASGDRHEIAGLYFYQQLDCLVDLAAKVSRDFFRRPKLYINLGEVKKNELGEVKKNEMNDATSPNAARRRRTTVEEITKNDMNDAKPRHLRQVLAELHARFGYHELFPSNAQRDEIFRPIFGSGGAYSPTEEGDFPRLRDALIGAAAAFAERVYDTGVVMLRERFLATTKIFVQYLKGLQGDSIRWSRESALSGLAEDFAYPILRNRGVAGVFGIDASPDPAWPYTEDANGDKLVEAISLQLKGMDRADTHIVTLEEILNRQRAALRGAEAIATLIDLTEPTDPNDLERLITMCYTWGSALLSLNNYPSAVEVGLRAYPGTSNQTSETR